MWVWHGHPLVQDAAEQKAFFEFLAAPKGDTHARISVVFVSRLGVEDATSRQAVGDFVAEAHRRSVRVDYLCGDEHYATKEHEKDGLWQLAYVMKYNRSVSPERRLDGIQFDVEPYALPGWPSKTIFTEYLKFLSDCGKAIRDSGEPLKLGAAIPRWFDGKDLGKLYKLVLDRVDYVAVMDYVDKPQAFVEDARNTVVYAGQAGKEAWLGAETTELPDEPMATFFKAGNAAMEGAFTAAYHAFGTSKGFAGVAVEYYETYRALRP